MSGGHGSELNRGTANHALPAPARMPAVVCAAAGSAVGSSSKKSTILSIRRSSGRWWPPETCPINRNSASSGSRPRRGRGGAAGAVLSLILRQDMTSSGSRWPVSFGNIWSRAYWTDSPGCHHEEARSAVRVLSGEPCPMVCAPPAPPPRVAPRPAIPAREAGSSAASRRRSTRSPTGWPSGCSASSSKTGTRCARDRQPRRPAPDSFPGTGHVGRPPRGRGNVVRGSGGCSPARGFREAKTHLAPPKPRNRGAASRNRVSGCPAGRDRALSAGAIRARTHPPRKGNASVGPRLAEKPRCRDLSLAQIVRSIKRGIE